MRKKKNGFFRYISRVISNTVLVLLIFIGLFLVLYVISGKISQSKGENPKMGLFTIISPSMTGTLNVYDVVFTKKINNNDYKVGDIITFYSTNEFFKGTPITHRIIDVVETVDQGKMFVTKGDANSAVDSDKVFPNNVLGKVLFKIPQLGRIQFFLASKGGWLIGILIPALAIIAYDIYKVIKLVILKSKLLELKNKHGNI